MSPPVFETNLTLEGQYESQGQYCVHVREYPKQIITPKVITSIKVLEQKKASRQIKSIKIHKQHQLHGVAL